MVKTRFAPSPTGYVHIGNIRTAFLCWLFARKENGIFYLRIDDTDVIRNSYKYLNNIIDTLKWLNIYSTEQIVYQSKNYDKYRDILLSLINNNQAYRCYCEKSRLDDLKSYQLKNKKKISYDGFCRDKYFFFHNRPFVVRFRNVFDGSMEFVDLVKGRIIMQNIELDDFIIAKNDYMPTYNFASVIDDIFMGITHIIRGDDHVVNTFKQIKIFSSLQEKLPKFAHLPMILDESRKVLSKRNNTSYMDYYRQNGFLPMAILNYIIRLSWGFKDKEIFSLDEMVNLFDFNGVSQSPSSINHKKLIWLNRYYMKVSDIKYLVKYFLPIEKKFKLNYSINLSIYTLIRICKDRVDTLRHIVTDNLFLYVNFVNLQNNLYEYLFSDNVKARLLNIYSDVKYCQFEWNIVNIKKYIEYFTILYGLKISDVAIVLRIIITGDNKSFPIYDLLFLCGRILLLKKIRNIIKETRGYSSTRLEHLYGMQEVGGSTPLSSIIDSPHRLEV